MEEGEADFAKAELEAVTKRWEADMKSDSYLSKNIRPLTLIAILSAYFLFAITEKMRHCVSFRRNALKSRALVLYQSNLGN